MKKSFIIALLGIMVIAFSSCKEEKKPANIIAKKPIVVKPKQTQKMGDYEHSTKVEWVGSVYSVNVKFSADPSLPTVTEGSQRYYDNKIQLKVIRKDGSEFFNRTFTKSDFMSYIDDTFKKNGALLGIVFDRTDTDNLYFAASVGSPDKSSDEYIPLVLKLSRFGEVTISKDTQMDISNEDVNELEQAEEDGV